jgi:hypothetical protein
MDVIKNFPPNLNQGLTSFAVSEHPGKRNHKEAENKPSG